MCTSARPLCFFITHRLFYEFLHFWNELLSNHGFFFSQTLFRGEGCGVDSGSLSRDQDLCSRFQS